ncbi:MAG: citrate/2-methylcitrate synthase [Spirochaetaceae bacterium]|nr:citrate/2-methylcitrate synthase [Spirochaetaceae bacterium]
MKTYDESSFINKLSTLTKTNDPIDPSLYQTYDVKRGLRNTDGRGVLVGLTKIGDVVGYEMVNNQKVAIPGKLYYRGYDVEKIIEDSEKNKQFGFEQIIYLLVFGVLPTSEQLEEFRTYLGNKRELPSFFTEDMIMKAPSPDIMNKLARGVLASYSYDKTPENTSLENVIRQCLELIARFPSLVANGYQAKRRYYDGQSMYIHFSDPNISTAENFLRLVRSDSQYTRLEAELLDLALILHAEHGGGNNSSFTVHVVSSTDTDTYSAIAAAVGSLKGKRHGGANLQVMKMMDELKANVKDWSSEKQVRGYLEKIVRKEAGDRTGLIYGIGHAIYTISDPRAVQLKRKAEQLAKEKGCLEEFHLYNLIEEISPSVLYELKSKSKRFCANVDLYSGFVYSMLNIPRELFTPIFAISRVAGWSAHRIEEVVAGGRIYRPAYKNILEPREYIPMSQRS